MSKIWSKISGLPKQQLAQEGEEVIVIKREKSVSPRLARKTKQKSAAKTKDEWFSGKREGQLVVDIYEKDDNLFVKSAIAGVKPKDIDITVEPDLLVVRGKREKGTEEEAHYYRQECFWGKFSRTLVLPCPVKPDKVKANLNNGVLTITLPKAEYSQGVKVDSD